MTRVREESVKLGTREGIIRGVVINGGVITSAGLVLAVTFCALGAIPILFRAQIAVIVAFGVLLDTVSALFAGSSIQLRHWRGNLVAINLVQGSGYRKRRRDAISAPPQLAIPRSNRRCHSGLGIACSGDFPRVIESGQRGGP
nr:MULTISPECIES: MMPL family transporter [Arthrobacter]